MDDAAIPRLSRKESLTPLTPLNKVVVAIAGEMAAFVWAIARVVQEAH
jgi:hypothetical protein